jgi:hypothetical protein
LKRIKERIMRRTETKPEGGRVETYTKMEVERRQRERENERERFEETEREDGHVERDTEREKGDKQRGVTSGEMKRDRGRKISDT